MSCHIRSVHTFLCFLALVSLVQCSSRDVSDRKCYSTVLETCQPGETCEVEREDHPGGFPDGICVCLRDYRRNDLGHCLPVKTPPGLPTPAKINSDTKSSSASIAAGVLVPLLFIGVAVLFVLGRRYGWWERLRQPRIRHYDTALVGGDLDDDPPIA